MSKSEFIHAFNLDVVHGSCRINEKESGSMEMVEGVVNLM